MTRIHAKSARVYKDELDFSGVGNGVEIVVDNIVAPVTAFPDADTVYVEGDKPAFTIDFSGIFSKASPNLDNEMFTDITLTGHVVGIHPDGRGVGNLGYEAITNPSSQARATVTNQAILLPVRWRGDKPLVNVEMFHTDTAYGATTTPSARQVGALSSTLFQMTCVVRVLSVSGGSPTLDAVLRSDDNSGMSSATTRHTFTQLTAAGFEKAEVAGAVSDDWWDLVLTYGGTGTMDLMITIGIGPKAG